ncbi:hypothetical protein, partial [Bosea sp. FBZP-16]|uniref:hypothetical protein n=1 Tax=Bosea sp. FBZP-16 TaxID=2065382 RepID=UPI001AECB886
NALLCLKDLKAWKLVIAAADLFRARGSTSKSVGRPRFAAFVPPEAGSVFLDEQITAWPTSENAVATCTTMEWGNWNVRADRDWQSG